MQTESLYRVPKAEIRSFEERSPRRFSLLAVAGGLLTVLIGYLAVSSAAALSVGLPADPDRSILENTAIIQNALSQGIGRLLVILGVGVAFASGGLVAAKLGRPRYALHAGCVGAVVAALYLGALLLLHRMELITLNRPARSLPMAGLVILALPLVGGWIARWHEGLWRQ